MLESEPIWKRKMGILMTKILFWLEDTETGLLDELKFYGSERQDIQFFRSRESEENIFQKEQTHITPETRCIIESSFPLTETCGNCLLIKDIPLIDEALRRYESTKVDIEKLYYFLEILPHSEDLTEAIRYIEALYGSLPERPT